MKYNKILAEYFEKKPLYLDEPANDEPNIRKLMELPWQQTKGNLPEISGTLSDLFFIEAKCKSGKIYDLLNDFDGLNLLIKIPELKFVRQAVASTLSGFNKEPEYHLPMLWNQMTWLLAERNVPDIFRKNLNKAEEKLTLSSVWLRSLAPLPDTEQFIPHQFPVATKYIQALNMKSGSLAVTDGSSIVEVVDIVSGKLILKKIIESNDIVGITVSDKDNKLAAIDKNRSLFIENRKTKYKTSQNENLVGWVNGFIFFIRDDDCLVAWNPDTDESKVLLESVSKPLVVLSVDKEAPGFLYVTGYRKQISGTAVFDSGEWAVKLLHELSSPVVAGDINLKNGLVVLGTADSILFLIDINSNIIFKKSSYQSATGSRIRGMLKRVSFGTGPSEGTVFLSTETGQVWNWNYKTNTYYPYNDFRKVKEAGICLSMDVWPDTGFPFVTTEYKAMTLTPADIDSQLKQPVSSICFTDNSQIAATHYEGHSVCFYNSTSLKETKTLRFNRPLSIGKGNEPDTVWIGGDAGLLSKAGINSSDILNDTFIVANPVNGIFRSNEPGMLWVALTNGDIIYMSIKQTDIYNDKKETFVLWNGTGYEKRLKVLPASNHGTFWCMTAIENKQLITISLVHAVQKEVILAEEHNISDIAVSNDYSLFAIAGNFLQVYHSIDQNWSLLYSCTCSSGWIAFTPDNKYLITATDCWLYIRSVSSGLPVITAQLLTSRINCLAVQNKNIAAGLQNGRVVSFKLKTKDNN